MTLQSALIVLVPEAEPLVSAMRLKHDPAAAAGVPAHFTLLYPFRTPTEMDAGVRDRLRACLSACPPLDLHLARLERFPRTLYLAPEPAAPLRTLIQEVLRAFPECPPYGGQFADVVPHLTLADDVAPEHLDELEAEFMRQAGAQLPLPIRIRQVSLVENSSGRWAVREHFPLGGA